MPRDPHVRAADLRLDAGVDPRAVGAAFTTQLCGHWEHEGPCRWPHHNAMARTDDGFALRVVFVAPDEEVVEVESRIESLTAGALRALEEGPFTDDARQVLRGLADAATQRVV